MVNWPLFRGLRDAAGKSLAAAAKLGGDPALVLLVSDGPEKPPGHEPPSFSLGDVVQLKSGGFGMTIVSCGCCGTVDVAWCCHSSGDIREECFERACLQPFNPNQSACGDVPF